MSFGKTKPTTSSSTQSSTTYGTDVWGPQQQYLQDMYGQAQGMAGQPVGGMGALNQAQGAYGQGMAGLQQFMNPGQDPRMAMYANQVGQNFNEQVLPGLRGQAMMAGGYGNSRAGIGEGLAGARAGQQLQDFGAQLYGENANRAMQAAGMYGQFGQGLQGLAQQQAQQPWQNLNQYGALLGGPAFQNLGGVSSGTQSGSGGGGFNFSLPIKM